jgi:two-component system chemotaxis response regulator CheB
VPKSKLTSGERLQRKGQAKASTRRQREPISNLIIVGASAGGYRAVVDILKDLPGDIPAAIIIIIHSALGSSHGLSTSLGRFTSARMVDVEKPERLRQGTIFFPPPGKSLTLDRGIIAVDSNDTSAARPITTINRAFTSAANAYGQRVIGVILSGLLRDGTDGLRAVHEAGGVTVVQDPREAEYPGMPMNAMADLPVTFCLKLSDIGPALELLVRRDTQLETGLAVAVRILRKRVALLVRLGDQSRHNPGTHEFLMKELASLKRNLKSIDRLIGASFDSQNRNRSGR